jgi:hypothetical protein
LSIFSISVVLCYCIFDGIILYQIAKLGKTIDINNKKHDYFAIFVLFDSIYTDFNRKIAFMT